MNAFPRLAAVSLDLATILVTQISVFGDAGAQTHTNPGPPAAVAIAIICYTARKQPIGGWLLYYYITLYVGLAVSLLLLAATLQNYSPARWQSTGLYALAIASTTLQQLILITQTVVATILLKRREWKWLKVLRAILIGGVIWSAISIGVDSAFFSEGYAALDCVILIQLVIWLAYFFRSERVKRVFLSKDWSPEVNTVTSAGASASTAVPETPNILRQKTETVREGKLRPEMNIKTLKENASEGSSSQPPGSITQQFRLRRTLLFAGVFALLAMLFVPTPEQHGHRAGYRWIFDRSDTSIAFFQLLLNVGFAALVGALVANFSRRVVLWTARIVAIAVVAVAALVGFSAFQQQMKAEAEREEVLARFQIELGNFELAKEHFLKASNYWWWKGWWEGARQARERGFDDRGMQKQAAVFRAQRSEERAKQLLRVQRWDNAWHYPSDENVSEAKQLLLDAAESWHIAGNIAEEQRLRTRENTVKTERELLASLADQPSPNPPFNPDAYLASKEEEKLIHDPIDYQRGKWTTGGGQAFVVAKFFERNLGDRKPDLDALADQLGAQKRYTLIEKQKRGGVWWVRVFLYRQATQTYVVQTGDTLFSISRKFYESPNRWKEILDANRKSIRDPKKLTVGQTLIIP